MKLLFSILILAFGVGTAWLYLRPGPKTGEKRPRFGAGDRPWRRVGAGICLLLSVMFVVGIYVVDIPDHPRPYAAYWIIMLGLVVWLCILAVKDVRYTRKMIARWQSEQRDAKRRAAGSERRSAAERATSTDSQA